MKFPYYSIEFKKNYSSDEILVSGAIRNYTSKSYNTAVFRIILYRQSKIIGSGLIKVHDFKANITRDFEAVLNISHKVIPRISGFDIVFDSGF